MKKGLKFVLILALLVIFSGCDKSKKQKIEVDNLNKERGKVQLQQRDQEKIKEGQDQITFEDPGEDEVGSEIKELDDLINEISPSEYDSTVLSDKAIEDDVELE